MSSKLESEKIANLITEVHELAPLLSQDVARDNPIWIHPDQTHVDLRGQRIWEQYPYFTFGRNANDFPLVSLQVTVHFTVSAPVLTNFPLCSFPRLDVINPTFQKVFSIILSRGNASNSIILTAAVTTYILSHKS